MSALLGILGVVMLVWGLRRALRNAGPGFKPMLHARPVSQQERDLEAVKSEYMADKISAEQLETAAGGIVRHGTAEKYRAAIERELAERFGVDVDGRPLSSPVYTKRTEVHIHNAQPGHHLHLHLGE